MTIYRKPRFVKELIRSGAGRILFLWIVTLTGCCLQRHPEPIGQIRFEHIALNVQDPAAVADWYCRHLGMKIQRTSGPPFNTRFVSDSGGHMMFEFYQNSQAPVPDYFHTDPGSLHIAFVVEDIDSLFEKLRGAGATAYKMPERTATSDIVCILRDPWGIPIQLVKRQHRILQGHPEKIQETAQNGNRKCVIGIVLE
jgi:glyoxylase I family protein